MNIFTSNIYKKATKSSKNKQYTINYPKFWIYMENNSVNEQLVELNENFKYQCVQF